MWALSNRTAYAADRNWSRDKNGNHLWIVAVKATFDIGSNGRLTLADEQIPPLLAPEFHGDPSKTSLKYDSDLFAEKSETDVILNAKAHAPAGRTATKVDVLLRVDAIAKHLVVYGERIFYQGFANVTTTAPRPFTSCPILYEYAFGGSDLRDASPARQRIDARNPLGRGVASNASSLVDQPAHRIEYPSGDASRVGPAGFGPVASNWSPRVELAGTYDAAWEKTKKPLLPDDYDPRHTLCAPVDQRVGGWLRGGELVELVNLSADGVMRFELPRLFFTYATRFGSRIEEHRGHLSTVIIEPDDRRVMAVYQTSLKVARRDVAKLDDTVIKEKAYVR